jgi:Uma2 family endonuclease
MNVALRKPMTLPEFLAWEERQELRYEFDGFQPVAMAGGTAAHSAIQTNLIIALGIHLRGKACRPHGSELKIEVAGRIRYPEAFVVCTPVPPRSKVVTDAVVVFEVLGDGTAHDDLVVKNAEYRATPSIQRYVILQQTHAGAVVFTRKGEDWVTEIVNETGTLRMPEIDIEIPMTEIYGDIDLTPDQEDGFAQA